MQSAFFVLFACLAYTAVAQYDDISVLGEVLDRTTAAGKEIEGSGVEAETTSTTSAPSTEPETLTPTLITEAPSSPSTEDSSSSSSSSEDTTTQEVTSTTDEVLTGSSTEPSVALETSTIEEEGFLGFKKPDLATIYKRLFPFQHGRRH